MQNVDNIRMIPISEPVFQFSETISEYDIEYIDNTSFKPYKDNYPALNRSGETNLYAYHIKLMLKIGETSPLKRERFIDYQIQNHKDPLTWLMEIDDLINQNYYQFEDKPTRWESFEDFREIIQKKVEEIEDPEKPIKSEIYWQKSDTDLLELVTALMESGSINNQTKNLSRKDAIKFFESFFNLTIKDPENKLSKATTRKIDQLLFLNSLIKAFKEYCDRKLK